MAQFIAADVDNINVEAVTRYRYPARVPDGGTFTDDGIRIFFEKGNDLVLVGQAAKDAAAALATLAIKVPNAGVSPTKDAGPAKDAGSAKTA